MTKARDLANSAAAFASVSATELGYVDGVTSAIQTQMDAKAPSSTAVTLTGTQTLTNKTLTSPVIASVINNTLTSTTGDIIYASAANTPARLGIGSASQVLTVASGIPSWATPAGGGSTVKVNYVNPSGDFTSSSASAVDITGYTITFTPISATNKIFISYNLSGTRSATDSPRIVVDIGGVTQSLKPQIGNSGLEWSYQGAFVMTNIAASSTTIKLRINPGGTATTMYGTSAGFVGQNLTVMEIY